MHPRLAVGRLGHRAVETDAAIEQPLEGLRHRVAEYPSERIVIARGKIASKPWHVLPVVQRLVNDSFTPLVWRLGCTDRSDRPGGGSAEAGVFLQQDGSRPGLSRFDRGGKSSPTATHDDHIKLLNRHPDRQLTCSTGWFRSVRRWAE